MVQDGKPAKDAEAKGAGRAAKGREDAALACRSDWDNPFGDEPSVPIIYEPF